MASSNLDFKAAAPADVKQSNRKITLSAPATLFQGRTPSLQNIIFDRLLEEKGSLKNVLEYLKSLPQNDELIKNAVTPRLIQELLKAMIDDDIKTVKMILDFDPQLLLVEPKDFGVTEIESKLTWQIFITEKPFIMAQKLKRLEMTKAMLPYFETLVTTPLEHWVVPELLDEKSQAQQDEKLQEKYIKEYFDPLITAIVSDDTAQANGFFEATHIEFGVTTEQKLQNFREKVLPNKAVSIDCLDVEQFLIAACKAFDRQRYIAFQTTDQRNIFAICVVGFILSILSSPLDKMYCESLYTVLSTNHKHPLGLRALDLKLYNDVPFHRASRDSRSGMGFTFLCGPCGFSSGHARGGLYFDHPNENESVYVWLERYVKEERAKFYNLKKQLRIQTEPPIKLRLHI